MEIYYAEMSDDGDQMSFDGKRQLLSLKLIPNSHLNNIKMSCGFVITFISVPENTLNPFPSSSAKLILVHNPHISAATYYFICSILGGETSSSINDL